MPTMSVTVYGKRLYTPICPWFSRVRVYEKYGKLPFTSVYRLQTRFEFPGWECSPSLAPSRFAHATAGSEVGA